MGADGTDWAWSRRAWVGAGAVCRRAREVPVVPVGWNGQGASEGHSGFAPAIVLSIEHVGALVNEGAPQVRFAPGV
jgi:hypothetical protein